MSFLLKNNIHRSIGESIYSEILSKRSNYYYFISRALPWDNEATPDSPIDTGSYEHDVRNDIILIKRIGFKDVSFVVPRINWVLNTVYDQYDDNYSSEYPAYSGAESLKDANFYVLTSTFGVYKCLFNNGNSQSTVEPFGLDVTPVTYGDGYVWKYMYTIPLSSRNRFLTSDYMPVQTAVTNTFYSNGEISSIVIDNPGSGYLGNADVVLTVNGSFIGANGNSIANLTPVLDGNGKFIDVIIDAPGNNYSNATITITDSFGSGNSYYNGIANVRVFSTGAGYTTAVRNNTQVNINTTGNIRPAANAVIVPVYSGINNTIVALNVLNAGSGYTTAVRNNTTFTISTAGPSQPTANASGNIFYNSSAVLTPILYNGRIDRVVISDPGINYSDNTLTTISITGDGQGASLLPVINGAGQLEDIIVESRGQGYTYASIQVTGTGSNANATALLSTGDLSTVQSLVELSTVDGGIFTFRINNEGSNYTSANVSVYGDGTGFIGNVTLSNSNTISGIVVTNPGINYKYANVVISGNGANANITAILSPQGGHGSNAVKELFADTLMMYSTLTTEKNQGVTVNNDYRQFGIIKNVSEYDSEYSYISEIGSACHLITLDTVSGIAPDTVLTATDTNSQLREFVVVEKVASTNQALLVSKSNYEIEAGDILQNNALSNFTVVSIDQLPDINKFTGDLLYIDNRTTVSSSNQQVVTLRTIIQL